MERTYASDDQAAEAKAADKVVAALAEFSADLEAIYKDVGALRRRMFAGTPPPAVEKSATEIGGPQRSFGLEAASDSFFGAVENHLRGIDTNIAMIRGAFTEISRRF